MQEGGLQSVPNSCCRRELKVAYYSFIRAQEVYSINVQIYYYFFCINILITNKKIGTQCVHVCYLKVIVGYDVFSCAL